MRGCRSSWRAAAISVFLRSGCNGAGGRDSEGPAKRKSRLHSASRDNVRTHRRMAAAAAGQPISGLGLSRAHAFTAGPLSAHPCSASPVSARPRASPARPRPTSPFLLPSPSPQASFPACESLWHIVSAPASRPLPAPPIVRTPPFLLYSYLHSSPTALSPWPCAPASLVQPLLSDLLFVRCCPSATNRNGRGVLLSLL